MRVIWMVMRKEFLEIFRDRRRFLWTLAWALFLMPLMYTLPLLLLLKYSAEEAEKLLTVPTQGLEYAPDLATFLEQENIVLTPAENLEDLIRSNEYPVGLLISPDYQAYLNGGQSARVTLLVDPRKTIDFARSRLQTVLKDYADQLRVQRLQQKGLSEGYLEPLVVEEREVATMGEASASQLSIFLPVLIFSLGLSAGMPMAVACLAGEKKAQTLESVLFTPVNRAHLLIGKWLALLGSILFNLFLSTLSFFITFVFLAIGVVTLSMGSETSTTTETASLSSEASYVIQPQALGLLLLIMMLLIAFGTLIELVISAWARNDEEAYSYMTPISLFSLLAVVVGISSQNLVPKLWHYAIPLFGAIFSMRDLLNNRIEALFLAVVFLSTCICIGLAFYLAVWVLSREEAVFRS